MKATSFKQFKIQLTDKTRMIIFDIICYLFIILFAYTAVSKMMNFSSFVAVLKVSPLIGHLDMLVAFTVIAVEVILCIVLVGDRTKRLGLRLSMGLMVVFTLYLTYMVLSGDELPCQCGGVISLMSWKEHIIFNSVFIILAFIGLKISEKLVEPI